MYFKNTEEIFYNINQSKSQGIYESNFSTNNNPINNNQLIKKFNVTKGENYTSSKFAIVE